MNRRGSIQDFGYMIILIFSLGLIFLAFTSIWNPVIEIMKNSTGFNESANAQVALNVSENLTNRFDTVIFATLIAFFLAIIIVSWYVPIDSIFLPIYFIGLVVFIVIALIFSYVWNSYIITTPAFASSLSIFPITNYILENFGLISAVIGFLGMTVLFAKGSQ